MPLIIQGSVSKNHIVVTTLSVAALKNVSNINKNYDYKAELVAPLAPISPGGFPTPPRSPTSGTAKIIFGDMKTLIIPMTVELKKLNARTDLKAISLRIINFELIGTDFKQVNVGSAKLFALATNQGITTILYHITFTQKELSDLPINLKRESISVFINTNETFIDGPLRKR